MTRLVEGFFYLRMRIRIDLCPLNMFGRPNLVGDENRKPSEMGITDFNGDLGVSFPFPKKKNDVSRFFFPSIFFHPFPDLSLAILPPKIDSVPTCSHRARMHFTDVGLVFAGTGRPTIMLAVVLTVGKGRKRKKN